MLLFPGLTNPFSGLVFKWAMGHPGLFFVYFRSFHTNITIFNTNILGKCPSSIQCWDSNPRHVERESPPIMAR